MQDNRAELERDKAALGDRVAKALSLVGITEQRVTNWIGAPCGCSERREKLNRLDRWARRILRGRIDRAKEFLDTMLKEDD